ncbi:hypothetical protein KAFR_0F00510 [Kazachstania africana CBS 2517]|uniref:Inhibitor I9 domain-containing protein n=1 Tax=Kazachstania africana (strain ATCC 22294 / BCRC 22015 / CBS 2517 / CECT 1963 / NBRC 1671 / NRRL Y-8276) TaxID=1071382 RepID=H2AW98_KAZAF|nr:hypothetical protein KAFR_0F00510 [Kazachstania africana CBS 2517]CCF58648.1 hypothetical protein KAFR_0F00510 [Kazachstania africana CBS 2517]
MNCKLILIFLLSIFILPMSSSAKSTTSYILSVDTGDNANTQSTTNLVSEVKSLVSKFQGKITHDYKLINGFSFEIYDKYVPTLKTEINAISDKFGMGINLEEDKEVHAFNNLGKH